MKLKLTNKYNCNWKKTNLSPKVVALLLIKITFNLKYIFFYNHSIDKELLLLVKYIMLVTILVCLSYAMLNYVWFIYLSYKMKYNKTIIFSTEHFNEHNYSIMLFSSSLTWFKGSTKTVFVRFVSLFNDSILNLHNVYIKRNIELESAFIAQK